MVTKELFASFSLLNLQCDLLLHPAATNSLVPQLSEEKFITLSAVFA
jgi:hypothetical protein